MESTLFFMKGDLILLQILTQHLAVFRQFWYDKENICTIDKTIVLININSNQEGSGTMRYGTVKVDQVTTDGKAVSGLGEILSPSELLDYTEIYFPDTQRQHGKLTGKFHDKKYILSIKNISYLGNPHPHFKKRIQISGDFKPFYDLYTEQGYEVLLLGVYKFGDNILFCDFNTESYVGNDLNNSSAHVYAIDLAYATSKGIFQKTDLKGNEITVFRPDHVKDFLENKFGTRQGINLEITDVVDDFFETIQKEWNGIQCYTEMIDADYHNKFQPEWTGFYLEFLLEQYIRENEQKGLIQYAQDKSDGGIDLDLYFPTIGSYGDLKAHSTTSGAIQGNDWDTVHQLLNEGQSIYYIVCDHETFKDKEYDFEVARFWNQSQNKSNPLSYGNKMKHHVVLTGYCVLEINSNNAKYLDVFKQGKNSNGKPRKPKIMIKAKNIENFLVHNKIF